MTGLVCADKVVVVSGAVVVVLVAINVTDHLLHPPWWVRGLEGAALLAWARFEGLSWAQLGLGRDRLRAGCRWALGAMAVVAGVYVVGVLLPLARPAFQDDRYDLPLPDALRTALLVIPLGTVLLEEVAFRSVLWGALSRHCRPWRCRWRPLSTRACITKQPPARRWRSSRVSRSIRCRPTPSSTSTCRTWRGKR